MNDELIFFLISLRERRIFSKIVCFLLVCHTELFIRWYRVSPKYCLPTKHICPCPDCWGQSHSESPPKSGNLPFFRYSKVAQSCLTLRDPMDCSLLGFSVHGIFQARVLEWGAIAFSDSYCSTPYRMLKSPVYTTLLSVGGNYIFLELNMCFYSNIY